MDELVKKEIKKIIKWRNTEVINTKYIFEYIANKEYNISKEDIEYFLTKKGYIQVSDNYMFQENSFIEYCNKNQIYDLVEFKKHIFIDYGVPYITIIESQFIEYLNLNSSGSEEIVVEHL